MPGPPNTVGHGHHTGLWRALHRHGPTTDLELAKHLAWPAHEVTRVRRELTLAGWVRPTGYTTTKPRQQYWTAIEKTQPTP